MEATAATANPAFAVNEDGSATEPKAFQQALREDAPRMAALQNLPEVAAILLGDDMKAMQDLLRQTWQAEKARKERVKQRMAHRTIDAQRATATVPRDTEELYRQLREAGLQYGPAFRLLRNVHVPESVMAASAGRSSTPAN